MKLKSLSYVVLLLMIIMLCLSGCDQNKSKNKEKGKSSSNGSGETTFDIEESISKKGIAFSKPDFFYEENTEVELLISKPGNIYYTLDGTEPSATQTQYNNAIQLTAGKDTKATTIKAKAFFEDGTESETIVHTYFVGKDVHNRFDMLVFSVTTDPYNLFDYEYGIFVEGKLRDDYIKDNPGIKIDPDDPANYNMRGRESEREVYLEILEPDGTLITEQAAGIRTYGGWSRANRQKSIKIFARKEYDEENNKIRYEFFPNKTSADGKGNALDTFKQLVLRNCGNDNGFAFIRDELFQTLAAQAGYQDYQAVRPVVLFMNGEYRGFFWLHEVYCDEYFEDNYGDFDGSFEILEGGETFKKWDEDGENAPFIEEYETIYNKYSAMDLTDETAYQELNQLIDVENYLSYYALQIYIGNEDWPHNNYKTYRYYTGEGESYKEAPFDGKWRYLLHDLDFSFSIYGTNALVDNIGNYVGEKGEIMEAAPLFGQLMRREDCKEIFIKKTLDLINGSFAPNNVSEVLDTMNESRLMELQNMYGANLLEDWVTHDQLGGRLDTIKWYAIQRASHITDKYREYFGLGDVYELTVQPVEGCKITVNSFTTEKEFIGSYYSDYNTVISAIVTEGKEIDYWQVNGQKVESKELIINSNMIKDGKVKVTLVIK